MLNIKVIKTETENEQALERVSDLMDAAPDSPEEEELEVLVLLIEKYEKEHYPIGLPKPIDAIKFEMEQQGLSHRDMQQYLGSASKVSEVLSGKRPLSLTMIRKLYKGLGIPYEVLLQQVECAPAVPQPEHALALAEKIGEYKTAPKGG